MRKRTDHRRAETAEHTATWPARLTWIALGLALAIVIARGTIEQNVRDREMVLPGSPMAPRAAGAATGVVLDLFTCIPAILVLWRRAADPDFRLRTQPSHVIFGALAILAAASSFWASDKFTAAMTSAHMIAAAALMWAMTQLVRTWVHLRLVVAACFAILLICIANGVMYRLIEHEDNIRYWQEYGPQELVRLNFEPGSFAAEQFERKLLSGELTGFYVSPNTFAAILVLLGVVSAGAILQRIRDRDEPGWAAVVGICVAMTLFPLWYTYSRTSLITPFFAAAILLVMPWLKPQWRKPLYIAGAAVIVLGTLALIGHGLYHGSLVQQSLTYRWRYWVGAMRAFMQHPLVGVGWSNFGAYYLAARLPIASEEIKDPHNLVIRPLVELGIFGGILMLGWLARSWWELTTPSLAMTTDTRRDEHHDGFTAARAIFLICGAAMLFNIAASVDFAIAASTGPWYILLELLKRLLYFILTLLGFATILLRSAKDAHLDDRPAPWLLWAIIAAIAVFLVHNLIDFSLFEAGPMCVFAMLVGAALAARATDEPVASAPSNSAFRIAPAVAATLFWLGAALLISVPVIIAEAVAQSANDDIRAGSPSLAATKLRDDFDSLWIGNSDYAFRAALALQQSGAPVDEIRKMLDAAIRADPMRVEYYRTAADLEQRQPAPDSARLISAYEHAITLDPNSVQAHKSFGDALVQIGQPARAAEQYREALRYNDLLAPDEPKRLQAQQITEIEQKMQTLQK